MQVIDKKGEKVNARHILIKPLVVASDLENTRQKISGLVRSIKADSLSLCKAASEFSIDPYTKDNCGFFSDQATGSQRVPLSQLDPEVANIIRSMEVGEYTLPLKTKTYDGAQAFRVVYLKRVIPEHKASLTEDYQKIQQLALSRAQDEHVADWVQEYKASVYVWIDEKYVNCKELEGWKGLN